MPTKSQVDANRRNAKKSTGPTSASGKAASSLNALKSGIFAKSEVLPSEDASALQLLVTEYYGRWHPTTPEQRFYTDELVTCEWTLRRLRTADAQLWEFEHGECYRPDGDLPLGQAFSRAARDFTHLQRRIDATRRAYARALQALQQLQREAVRPEPQPVTESPETTSPDIGFVCATRPETVPAAPPVAQAVQPAEPRVVSALPG